MRRLRDVPSMYSVETKKIIPRTRLSGQPKKSKWFSWIPQGHIFDSKPFN